MINYLLVKLASRCNFDCSYCYWFRDGSVRNLPPLISEPVIQALLTALEQHITEYRLPDFTCSFHGGEPTLFGAKRLRNLLERIDEITIRTKCDIRYALTTNGALIDSEWVDLIKRFEIAVTVSIDGPPDVHDRRRIDVRGAPTWRDSVTGYFALCREGIAPAIIAVCDPEASPVSVLDHLAKDLGVQFCDILVPDCDHTSDVKSIAAFYIGLFDHWYDKYADSNVQVRILNECVRGLLGLQSHTESIGLAPTRTVCLSTSGQLEPHDVLRIAGEARIKTSCNIFSNRIDDIETDPLWLAVREASTNLCDKCKACRYKNACGGGHIAQRWSVDRQYDNPSVYCTDYIKILDHIAGRLKRDLEVDGGAMGPDTIHAALLTGRPEVLFSNRA
jgi:uncharacterized protein